MAVLYRHIRLDKNEPFYIGIGNSKHRASKKCSRNEIWNNIVNKTKYRVDILFDNLSWNDACDKEKEFIDLYGRFDLGNGMLVNMTNGGEGLINPSEEIRNKKRLSMMGKNVGDNNGMKKIENRIKVSKSKTGKQMGINHPRHRAVVCFNLDNIFIAEYDCIKSVERITGIVNNNIVKVCKGHRKTAGGFIWRYK